MTNIATQLEEMKDRSLSGGLSSLDKAFIESKYERITGKVFTKRGCSQCYHDAAIEMYTYHKKNGLREMGKYTLKRGAVLHYKDHICTRLSLTDKVAKEALAEYPTLIALFESYPENWQEDVKPTPKVKIRKVKQEEVKTTETDEQ